MTTSTTPVIDLSKPLHVHVVGVGGAGMSAIAAVLAGMGHHTTGSDIKPTRPLERLSSRGVEVEIGHRPENVAGADALTYSTAVSENNVELREARSLGIPVLSRAEMLEAIVTLRRTVAIAGTHGKTTTSSMLALVLVEAGLRPSFIIGGEVNEIGTNAAWDSGELLVVEADESDGTFLHLTPELGIVTSVEPDHLEHYGSFDELKEAFGVFLGRARTAVVCADDPVAASLAPRVGGHLRLRRGEPSTDRRGRVGAQPPPFRARRAEARASVLFELPVPGLHNARNAAAAVAAAVELGVDPEHARRALARFAGVARRFEFRGEIGGVTFVDDYAHLPGEVRAALDAALGGGSRGSSASSSPIATRVWRMLAPGFADCFEGADLVVVTDIYAAGEMPRPGVSGELVLDAVVARPSRGEGGLPAQPGGRRHLPARQPASGRLVPDAGGGRSHEPRRRARRTSRGERRPVNAVSKGARSAEIEKAAELLGPLAERDRPMGELTTYRVGGRAALFSEPGTVADLAAAGRRRRRDRGSRSSCSGRDRTCSSPTPASQDCACASAKVSPASRSRAISCGRVARPPTRSFARRTAAAGLTGLEWAVGIPGSVGGAVRMNAGGPRVARPRTFSSRAGSSACKQAEST